VDPDTSVDHCGGCGQSCFAGEVCSGGQCQGPVGADGCGALARNLTISQIAAYQTVKIPIMTGQQPVATGARVAAVIQGRETLFRVFVSLQAGWVARELSARLTLVNGASEDQYFAKKVIAGSSTDSQTTNTFQIFVPPDKIQDGTRYSVEVVECADATGTAVAPRFPTSGDTDLGARRTGPLKVTVIPVFTNNRLPDTSENALGIYRAYLAAMYPATDVQLTVGGQVSTNYPINWSGMLDQIRSKRQQDGPSSDVYYYGFVRPTETLREYCQSSCTAGIGYVGGPTFSQSRAAVGLAYGDEGSAKTMAHELGHNHGRNHAPCARGSISGVDQSYPHSGGLIGVWGHDQRTLVLIDPGQATDIMGYCSNQWVSDYTYRALTDRVATLNGAFFEIQNAEVAAWRVVLLDGLGRRWGLPYDRPGPAFGEPEQGEILDVDGNVIAVVTAYRTEVADIGGATVLVPEPKPGWTAVRLPGFAPLAYAEPVSVPQP
jgi:hypothetical protein